MKRVMRVRSRQVVHETARMYGSVAMREFVCAEIARKQWIYKIITGERESEAVIFQNESFMVLPDTEAPNEMGLLNWMVIFKDADLMSMRSLRGSHVCLLKEIIAKIRELLPAELDSPMVYFHYPPSVWQLHLHVAAPCDMLRTTNSMQKVCFVEDVVSNLEIDPDYYAKVTLSYVMPSTHELSVLCANNVDRDADSI
jgi:Scavenger mRNA decapping enzyme C-term binding